MKLYVCYGTWKHAPRSGGMHPCGRAYHALREAGWEPEVIKSYGLMGLPAFVNNTRGRREARQLTGSDTVPVLVTDDGDVIKESRDIEAWATAHPAAT